MTTESFTGPASPGSRRSSAAGPRPGVIAGFQPSFSPAREISGQRRTGSSWGRAAWTIRERLPVSSRTFSASSRMVNSSGIAQVDGADEILRVHQPDERLDEVRDVTERARLAPVAVDGQGLALERLDDEVADDPAVVDGHPRPVGVEDAGDPDLDPVLAVVVHHQGLGHPLSLVVTAPDADGIDVPPVGLRLGVDLGVAVDLGGRGRGGSGP